MFFLRSTITYIAKRLVPVPPRPLLQICSSTAGKCVWESRLHQRDGNVGGNRKLKNLRNVKYLESCNCSKLRK